MELQRLSSKQFDQFRDFIYETCGIRVAETKVTLLSNRVRRRLKAGDFENFDAYFQFLTSPGGAKERDHFLDAITTNESSFFRTQKHFDWFSDEFLSDRIARQQSRRGERSLKVWSAGCAGGAEPYTMSICLAEQRHRLRDWSTTILGTDISEEVLRGAREGVFKSRDIESVTQAQRRRFFQHAREEDVWRVRPELKRPITFLHHNLMDAAPRSGFDCVFIRNVLIYFDQNSKRVVLNHLLDALRPGGFLVVGPSEGVFGMLSHLKKVSPLIYQKVDNHGGPRQIADDRETPR